MHPSTSHLPRMFGWTLEHCPWRFFPLGLMNDALTTVYPINTSPVPRPSRLDELLPERPCQVGGENADEDMDEPSTQLCQELRAAVTDALSSRRPLLHHLTADTAWLLQIPRPRQATRRGGRLYFNILIDPWLSGSQTDVTSWLSKQWHVVQPKVPDIAAVETLLREIELLACGVGSESNARAIEEYAESDTFVDAVAISHEFTDHCHRQTLLQVHPDVPVFASERAVSLIQSWNHFRSVQSIPLFSHDPDWHATSMFPLPEWLGISQLVSNHDLGVSFHSALLITFNNNMGSRTGRRTTRQQEELEDESAEAVVYSPHGIHSQSDDLQLVASAVPPIRTLALLHGLEHITLAAVPLNLGAHNGLKAQQVLRAKYWIGTHDEDKLGTGIVGWFLRRKKISVKDALLAEIQRRRKQAPDLTLGGDSPTKKIVDSFADCQWMDLDNGESFILH